MKIELTKEELEDIIVTIKLCPEGINHALLERLEKLGDEWKEGDIEYQRCDYCGAYPKLKPLEPNDDA